MSLDTPHAPLATFAKPPSNADDAHFDPLAWLEDKNAPATTKLIEAETAYLQQYFAPHQQLVANLVAEIKDRVILDDTSYPVRIDDYFYYSRTETTSEYVIHCRKYLSMSAAEEIILDENILAQDHVYFDLACCVVSPCHRYLAYCIDLSGDEQHTLYIKDCQTNQIIAEPISGLAADLGWSKDSSTIYYLKLNDHNRPYQCYRQRLDASPTLAECLFTEEDEKFFLGLHASKSDHYMFLSTESGDANETWFLDNQRLDDQLHCIKQRQPEVRYYIEVHSNNAFMLSNENATNFAIWHASCLENVCLDKASEAWQQVVDERPDVTIESIESFADYLVVTERHHEQLKLHIFDLQPFQPSHLIEFPDEVYNVETVDNVNENSNYLRYCYESLATPEALYDYDLITRQLTLCKQEQVCGNFDPKNYQTKRLMAKAADGTRIPISLVYRRDLPPSPQRPLYLYGYGAYGAATDVWFSSSRLSLLDRGVSFAIAHVRGGGDCGELWHVQGKMEHKQNTFTDFNACQKTLIDQGYVSAQKLIIAGGSAGGLLVGAAVNLDPSACGMVIADVPFVDTLNSMCNEQLSLTVTEYDEWGDPRDPEVFARIKSYAPYENVKQTAYPTFYVSCSLHDTRVPYWEAMKWVQKLRQVATNQPLVLLNINQDAGHGGPTGRFAAMQEIAEEYAFIIVEFGLAQQLT